MTHEWQQYLDILSKAADLPSLTWAQNDPQLRAEVHQQIAMNLMSGYFYYFQSDPNRPDFIPYFNSALRLQPNPDDIYYLARLDGRGTYRIYGERGANLMLSFTLGHDFQGTTEKAGGQQQECDADSLEISASGWFELLISVERPNGYAGNWLQMTHETNYVLVRMRSYRWGEDIDPRLAIERLDSSPCGSRLGAVQIDGRLRDLMHYAERTSRRWYEYQNRLRDRGYINSLEVMNFNGLGGLRTQAYWQGIFEIADEEALILETEIPKTIRYWNVQLNDQLFNALEFIFCQSSLNGEQAALDTDGKFRAVISISDPGVPNWLDTVGRKQGTIIGRWLESDGAPVPTLRKVPLESVREHLPPDTPMVDRQMRESTIRARARGGQLRRRW